LSSGLMSVYRYSSLRVLGMRMLGRAAWQLLRRADTADGTLGAGQGAGERHQVQGLVRTQYAFVGGRSCMPWVQNQAAADKPHLLLEELTRGTTLRASHLSSACTAGVEAVAASQRVCTAGSLQRPATATTAAARQGVSCSDLRHKDHVGCMLGALMTFNRAAHAGIGHTHPTAAAHLSFRPTNTHLAAAAAAAGQTSLWTQLQAIGYS
jgi:hypothetical protein